MFKNVCVCVDRIFGLYLETSQTNKNDVTNTEANFTTHFPANMAQSLLLKMEESEHEKSLVSVRIDVCLRQRECARYFVVRIVYMESSQAGCFHVMWASVS